MRTIVKCLIGIAIIIGVIVAWTLWPPVLRGLHSINVRAPTTQLPESATVRIFGADSTTYVFRAEIARTERDRERGFSGRASLPDGTGMLFVFDRLDYPGIWMKDMRFSIDLLWIAGGEIIDITEALPVPKPGETYLPIFRPNNPALLVLEVPAGTVARDGIRTGQRVEVVFDGE